MRGDEPIWVDSIRKYCKSADIFRCPSVPDWEVGRNMAYGYNYQYLGNSRPANEGGNAPVRSSDMSVAAYTICVADSEGTGTEPYRPFPSTDVSRRCNHGYSIDPPKLPPRRGNQFSCGSYPSYVSDRHNDGANLGFCDGHVKWLTKAVVYKDNSLWNGRGSQSRKPRQPRKRVRLLKHCSHMGPHYALETR